MAISQQKFREMVFQMLYSYDFSQTSHEAAIISFFMQKLTVTKKAACQAWSRMREVLEKLAEIDPLIKNASQSYSFERIKRVELNVLRLAIYEMIFDAEIPPKVAIAEAIRLTRKFSSRESSSFVNAVLDAVHHAHPEKKLK